MLCGWIMTLAFTYDTPCMVITNIVMETSTAVSMVIW